MTTKSSSEFTDVMESNSLNRLQGKIIKSLTLCKMVFFI